MRNAASAATKTYSGQVERYISGPTPDGFAIISLRMPNGSRISVKGTGILDGFGTGDRIEVKGRTTNHPRYGEQVQAYDARPVDNVVDSAAGLTKWLSEAGIEGIGKARAQMIAENLGEDAVERIIASDERARELLGGRFDTVRTALLAKYGEAKFGPRLAELGLGRQTRIKVYEAFGSSTAKVIESDPFRLITEVEGIAFLTADQLAHKAGMPKDSEQRIVAAARHVIREAETEGNTWLPLQRIIQQAASLTNLDAGIVARVTDGGPGKGLVAVKARDENGLLVQGWSSERLAAREEEFAKALLSKAAGPKLMERERAEELVSRHEAAVGKTLNALQRESAIMALVEPVCCITGGPGRGKTTTLEVIMLCWKELGRRIKQASPTGKAAQRMREATGLPASTMHRLLDSREGSFRRNARNPIEADAIAIDEGSMIDVCLAAAFGRAWGDAQILFVGDAQQLGSVDPGNVFADLVASKAIPSVRLVENRRQAEGSAIASGGEAICEGRIPEWKDDLVLVEAADNAEIAAQVALIFRQQRHLGRSVQILTPGHGSEAGTIALNEQLRVPDRGEPAARLSGGAPANVGDEVIQLENCEDRGLSNGDVGRIVAIDGKGNAVRVTVTIETAEGPKDFVYSGGQTSELGLAWALTVHKSQGSEYDVVIIPMTTSHWKLLRRTLFNTAVTRGKQLCVVVGQKRAIRQAVSHDDSNLRLSRLRVLIDEKDAA